MIASKDGWKYAVSLDTETTGLSRDARIVQIAALRFRWRLHEAKTPVVEFSEKYRIVTFVKPPQNTYFCPHATRVTGITKNHVVNSPTFEEVKPNLLNVLGALPIIAHNAPFDKRMLEGEFSHSGESRSFQWICSMQLAKKAGHTNTKLGILAAHFKIKPSGVLHDAGTDAELAAYIMAQISR